jgi:hypothetical protein
MTAEPTLGDVVVRLDRALDLQERGLARLDEEKYWRRLSVSVVVVVFLSFAVWVMASRQSDCHRVNASRAGAREATVSAFATTWDQLVDPPDPARRAALLDAIEKDQERLRPARDCAWPA